MSLLENGKKYTGIQNQLLRLAPFEPQDIELQSNVPTDTNPHNPPPDILQLQTDVLNVLENRVELNTFNPEYQKKIRAYYQFSGTVHLSSTDMIAKRTTDTWDLI